MRTDTHQINQDYIAADDLLQEAITPEDKALCLNWIKQFSYEYSRATPYWWK